MYTMQGASWVQFDELEIHDDVLEKVQRKHGVEFHEIEEACHASRQYVRRARGGLYSLQAQTEAGRHLTVLLARAQHRVWRIVSARDMNLRVRRAYGRAAQR
jgi:uncharacterized DUF497 family protein